MGILTDGNASLVASGLSLGVTGTPSILLAAWVRDAVVNTLKEVVKIRSSDGGTLISLSVQPSSALGVTYQGSVSNGAFKASGDTATGSWKAVMGLAYSSTGGSTVDRLRFWSGSATTGLEDSITPLTNGAATFSVVEVGFGDASDLAEWVFLTGVTLAEAQTFWTSFQGGGLPEGILASNTRAWSSLKDMTAGSLAIGVSGGALSVTGSGTIVASSTSPTHPISRNSSSFSGALVLDNDLVTGSFSTVPTGSFSGALVLDNDLVNGSFGSQAGFIVSEPLATNNGTLLANTSMSYVDVTNNTTNTRAILFTTGSTNASAVFSYSSPAIAAGTIYRVDYETVTGKRGMVVVTAT